MRCGRSNKVGRTLSRSSAGSPESSMADWRRVVRARLADLRLTASAESELTEEVAQHLEDLQRDLQSGGASDDEAYRETVSELDDIYALRAGLDRSQCMTKYEAVPIGDATSHGFIDDLRYAIRTMRTNPVFVLIVLVTLGLGIGANTTVFTVINTLILNPMAERVPSGPVAVVSVPPVSAAEANTLMALSYPSFTDYETQNSLFSGLAG